jgi:hypothetical protein
MILSRRFQHAGNCGERDVLANCVIEKQDSTIEQRKKAGFLQVRKTRKKVTER